VWNILPKSQNNLAFAGKTDIEKITGNIILVHIFLILLV
jgi:hypothetical protein